MTPTGETTESAPMTEAELAELVKPEYQSKRGAQGIVWREQWYSWRTIYATIAALSKERDEAVAKLASYERANAKLEEAAKFAVRRAEAAEAELIAVTKRVRELENEYRALRVLLGPVVGDV